MRALELTMTKKYLLQSQVQQTFKYIVANINEVNDNEEYVVQNMLEAHEWLQKKLAAGQQKIAEREKISVRQRIAPQKATRTEKESGILGKNRKTSPRNGYAFKRTKLRPLC